MLGDKRSILRTLQRQTAGNGGTQSTGLSGVSGDRNEHLAAGLPKLRDYEGE